MVDFGKRMRALRQEQEMTQRQVATHLGVTASIVSAYESGIRQPSYDVLIKIAALYRVSTDYLLGVSQVRVDGNRKTVSLEGLTPDRAALLIKLAEELRN